MNERKLILIAKAFAIYGKISLCDGRSLGACFTERNNKLCFWFNILDNTTKSIKEA